MHIEVTIDKFASQDATEVTGRIVVTGHDEATGRVNILDVKERLYDFLKGEYERWQRAVTVAR